MTPPSKGTPAKAKTADTPTKKTAPKAKSAPKPEIEPMIMDEFDDPVIPPMLPDGYDADLVMGTFKRWSASAVECYVREANCDGCYYADFFKEKPYGCKMNLAVEQLLQTLGEPSKNLLNKYG